MRIFLFFINLIYWLWAFIVPVIILGIPALLLYSQSPKNLNLSVTLLVTGIVLGVYIAEKIRKGYGLTSFFSRLSETPDIVDINEEKQPSK